MLTVLTLTYQRHHLLEEALQSFLLQDIRDCEMIILNDSPDVEYVFNHPKVRIINLKERFKTIGEKLEYGLLLGGEHIYRLDDDDLLAKGALSKTKRAIKEFPSFDIYHPESAYYLNSNVFQGMMNNINTGNTYSKKFIKRVGVPKISVSEDLELTFKSGGEIYITPNPTMIYRWGMGTYHISATGVNEIKKETGKIYLNPHFKNNYYEICMCTTC